MDLALKLQDPRAHVLFVVAHPDDEIIGAGGSLLSHFRHGKVVHVTDGAPANMLDARTLGFDVRSDYAQARSEESAQALSLAGISRNRIIEFGVTDQEASYQLVSLVRHLVRLMYETKAEIVITQPYEGGHPDHDSTAFAVHWARQLLIDRKATAPQIFEMTSYHQCGERTVYSDFVWRAGCFQLIFELSADQRRLKRKMFDCFVTQQKVLQWFPIEVERFREAPEYDFTQPPHAGKLHYEYFDWGMTGNRWRSLASEAEMVLRQGGIYDAHDFERSVSTDASWPRRCGWSRTDTDLPRCSTGARRA